MLPCYGIGMGELIPVAHPLQSSSHLLSVAQTLAKYDRIPVPYHYPTFAYHALVRDYIPV